MIGVGAECSRLVSERGSCPRPLEGPVEDQEVERIRRTYAARAPGDRYSVLRADQVAIAASRARVWGSYLLQSGRNLGTTLEVGCGGGAPLRWANEVGAACAIGVDVITERLVVAARVNPATPLVGATGTSLPFRNRCVDTVLCSTLFSSVLDDVAAKAIAAEIRRVLRPGGCVLWFDFHRDNPRNRHVRRMRRHDVHSLFPDGTFDLRSVVLAPPVASRLLRWPRLAALLEMVPILRTHLAGVVTFSEVSGPPSVRHGTPEAWPG